MAYVVNGRIYSYNYTELLSELRGALADGVVSGSSVIYIIRDREKVIADIYHPVVDYYFSNTLERLEKPLESVCECSDCSNAMREKLDDVRNALIQQYKESEPFFELATVTGVVTEMELWNSIL